MNKDQIKGRIRKAKGKAKTAGGKLVGNKQLEIEGRVQEAAGTVQTAYGDAKRDLDQQS